MRFFVAFLSLSLWISLSFAQQTVSHVYECHFTDNASTIDFLRMKESMDPAQNLDLGKVSYMHGPDVTEETATNVYQIPIWNQNFYIQTWYSNTLHVDAQMSLSGSNKNFPAIYIRGSLQRDLFCTTLSN